MTVNERLLQMLLRVVGTAFVLYGTAMLAVNVAQGMPIWWICAEGPFNLAFGCMLLWLFSRLFARRT